VIAIDLNSAKLKFAADIGAEHCLVASNDQMVEEIKSLTGHGVHLTLDAVGKPEIITQALATLRKGGCHLQVGLLPPEQHLVPIPFATLIANEFRIAGSHGMQAARYSEMIHLILEGRLNPAKIISKKIPLSLAADSLTTLNNNPDPGITVIHDFDN
jgi:alcohol dehydrogenase